MHFVFAHFEKSDWLFIGLSCYLATSVQLRLTIYLQPAG